jgi:hypothetical protein
VTAGIPVDCPFCGIERPDNGKAAESRRFFCGRRAQFFQFNFVRSFVQFPGFQEVGVRGIVCCGVLLRLNLTVITVTLQLSNQVSKVDLPNTLSCIMYQIGNKTVYSK